MREIKFRAWDKDDLCMRDWDNLLSHVYAKDKNTIFNDSDYEVMQFTGLHDKNGKEIYEGDIVIVRSQYETDEPVESRNKVYFRDGAFRCGFHNMILMENVCTGIEGNWNMEVIGNIYENPELAGGTTKGLDCEG